MTGNHQELPSRKMSAREGVCPVHQAIRPDALKSSADLTVGTPPVCGESGYHSTYGETTKSASEASSIVNQSRCETAREGTPDTGRLAEQACAYRKPDTATKPSSRLVVRASGGKAGRLQGARVIDWNTGTGVSSPAKMRASSSESGDGGTSGRSFRSSPRSGKPVTWRREADVLCACQKEEPPVDSGDQSPWDWLFDIQCKLYKWSRNNSGESYKDLWGWLIRPRNLWLAWERVRTNRGARSAGVDKLTVRRIEQRIGVAAFLGGLRDRLKRGDYRPSPVRRVMIPKRGKPGQFRPLGVPTVEDRVVQAALVQLLEPIFEADFLPVSYGFRPCRGVRDAVEHIRLAIKPPRQKDEPRRLKPPYQWVIEGDIKACFDNIDHHSVMTRVRRRIGDRKVTRLILAFLKAGVLSEGNFLRSESGTPQGGILSPLLANIVLSDIEQRYEKYLMPGLRKDGKPYERPGDQVRKFRHRERLAGRPVFLPIRYADDFVVLVAGTEQQARDEKEVLARYLFDELKLTLSEEKTHITPLTGGFEFLAHRIRLHWDERWGYWPRIEIPKGKVKDFRHKVKQQTNRGHCHRDFQDVIDSLNPLIRGWGNFYRHCYYAKGVFAKLDHYIWDRLRRWLRKKYPKTPRLEVRRRYWRCIADRPRKRWVDTQPVSIMADITVARHCLKWMRYPDYTQQTLESPVHTERCTPGSGTGFRETAAGNCGNGARSPRSLDKQS